MVFFDYDTGTWLKPITEVDIGNTVTNIGDLAFYECESLDSVTIPNTVISIGMAVFIRSGVSNIVFPPNVERIGDSAFFDCRYINSIVFQSKTISQVQQMSDYPWGIEDTSIISVSRHENYKNSYYTH